MTEFSAPLRGQKRGRLQENYALVGVQEIALDLAPLDEIGEQTFHLAVVDVWKTRLRVCGGRFVEFVVVGARELERELERAERHDVRQLECELCIESVCALEQPEDAETTEMKHQNVEVAVVEHAQEPECPVVKRAEMARVQGRKQAVAINVAERRVRGPFAGGKRAARVGHFQWNQEHQNLLAGLGDSAQTRVAREEV